MTQTLTTVRLREIASGDAFICTQDDESVAMARELLANREAQPVGYIAEVSGNRVGVLRGLPLPDVGSLIYTAPPALVVNQTFTGAPAVPEGHCIMPLTLTAANGAKGALSGEFKVARTVRCHECGGEGCDDCADAGEFEEEITVPWDTIKEIYRAAVDACRAAMLAAAPEGSNG